MVSARLILETDEVWSNPIMSWATNMWEATKVLAGELPREAYDPRLGVWIRGGVTGAAFSRRWATDRKCFSSYPPPVARQHRADCSPLVLVAVQFAQNSSLGKPRHGAVDVHIVLNGNLPEVERQAA